MPRTPEEIDRIRHTSKEKISTAAMELFMKQGYYATSVSDIAKQSGISQGLLYSSIRIKEQMICEFCTR